MKPFAAVALFALTSTAAIAAEAVPTPVKLGYGLTIAGIPIAHADLALDDRSGRYGIDVDWHTTGLVGIFAGAAGTVAADGRIVAGRLQPRNYRLTEKKGNEPVDVRMAMSGGRVTALSLEPTFTYDEDDRVPLLPQHRTGIVDPLSSGILGAGIRPESVCARTLPIFDGWTRWNLVLTPRAILDEAPAGMRGPTAVCAVRWVPVAGHRTGHRSVRFMSENRDIEVRLARFADRDAWAPVETSVGTMIGPVRVTLQSVEPAGH